MACVCGHSIEEHETPSGSCEGTTLVTDGEAGTIVECECAGWEPDEDEDEDV